MRRIDNVEKLNKKVKAKKREGKVGKYLHENFKARVINENPYIVKINNFLDDEEVECLLEMAEGKFKRSNIVVDGSLTYSNTRTSSTAYVTKDGFPSYCNCGAEDCQEVNYPAPIERIVKRLRYLTGCKREELEGFMVVRYRYMEQFAEHTDYFEPHEIGALDSAGNRVITVFVYLNTLEKDEGGETEFTKLGVKSRPKKGDAMLWYNQDPNTKEMLPLTEHKGNPVTKEGVVKYGANMWIRDQSFF